MNHYQKKCKDNKYAIEKELVKRKSEHIAFYKRKGELIIIYYYDDEEEVGHFVITKLNKVKAVVANTFYINTRSLVIPILNKSIWVNRSNFYTPDPTLLLNAIEDELNYI